MNKRSESTTQSIAVAPTASAGISSSALYDMKGYERAYITMIAHRGNEGTYTYVMTATVYQSTASTWNGAAAVTMGASLLATASIASASDVIKTLDVSAPLMDVNNDMRYIGVRCAAGTATVLSTIVSRLSANIEPVN
jgi:hypothetical protein